LLKFWFVDSFFSYIIIKCINQKVIIYILILIIFGGSWILLSLFFLYIYIYIYIYFLVVTVHHKVFCKVWWQACMKNIYYMIKCWKINIKLILKLYLIIQTFILKWLNNTLLQFWFLDCDLTATLNTYAYAYG
jgi:hypothetical protein